LLSTGIVRKTDALGHINFPKELRLNLDINQGDSLEIFTDGELIILQKYSPGCLFCGETMKLKAFKGRLVCFSCLNDIDNA
jgi:transcriptional pleiotropic regulator of transition state genes